MEKIIVSDSPRTDFRGSDLLGARAQGSDLSHANFQKCNMRAFNGRGCNARSAHSDWADLKNSAFIGATLRCASMKGVLASGTGFRGADLRGVDLRKSALRGIDLRKVDLRGADLCWADLEEAMPRGSDLRGAKYNIVDVLRISAYNASEPLARMLIGFARIIMPPECRNTIDLWLDSGADCPDMWVAVWWIRVQERPSWSGDPWKLWWLLANELGIKI